MQFEKHTFNGAVLDIIVGHPFADLIFISTQAAQAAGIYQASHAVSNYHRLQPGVGGSVTWGEIKKGYNGPAPDLKRLLKNQRMSSGAWTCSMVSKTNEAVSLAADFKAWVDALTARINKRKLQGVAPVAPEYRSNLSNPNQTMTMSSLEIAELTGKKHHNVLADIRTMLNELGERSTDFSGDYKDQGGRTYPCFKLDRHHTECLLTGYSAKMRMAVIKRWHELERMQILHPLNVGNQSQGAIIESLSGLQTEVKILKEMIRSIIAGPGVVREVAVKSPYEGTTKGTVSYHADAALIREIGETMSLTRPIIDKLLPRVVLQIETTLNAQWSGGLLEHEISSTQRKWTLFPMNWLKGKLTREFIRDMLHATMNKALK